MFRFSRGFTLYRQRHFHVHSNRKLFHCISINCKNRFWKRPGPNMSWARRSNLRQCFRSMQHRRVNHVQQNWCLVRWHLNTMACPTDWYVLRSSAITIETLSMIWVDPWPFVIWKIMERTPMSHQQPRYPRWKKFSTKKHHHHRSLLPHQHARSHQQQTLSLRNSLIEDNRLNEVIRDLSTLCHRRHRRMLSVNDIQHRRPRQIERVLVRQAAALIRTSKAMEHLSARTAIDRRQLLNQLPSKAHRSICHYLRPSFRNMNNQHADASTDRLLKVSGCSGMLIIDHDPLFSSRSTRRVERRLSDNSMNTKHDEMNYRNNWVSFYPLSTRWSDPCSSSVPDDQCQGSHTEWCDQIRFSRGNRSASLHRLRNVSFSFP